MRAIISYNYHQQGSPGDSPDYNLVLVSSSICLTRPAWLLRQCQTAGRSMPIVVSLPLICGFYTPPLIWFNENFPLLSQFSQKHNHGKFITFDKKISGFICSFCGFKKRQSVSCCWCAGRNLRGQAAPVVWPPDLSSCLHSRTRTEGNVQISSLLSNKLIWMLWDWPEIAIKIGGASRCISSTGHWVPHQGQGWQLLSSWQSL